MSKARAKRSMSSRRRIAPARRWSAVVIVVVVMTVVAVVALKASRKKNPEATATPTASAFLATVENGSAPSGERPEGMVWIPGGEFSMGAADPMGADNNDVGMHATDDSRPIHRVYVDGFWMDKTDVTNEQFEKFVKATGYVTIAERAPTKEEFPTAPPENLVAGSTVFTPTPGPVPLDNFYQWWSYVKGANWRHPTGPD